MVAIVVDRHRLRLALQAALPAAALLVFGTVVNFATSGSLGTQSIGGLSLLGHVLPLATPDVRTAHPDLYRNIVEATAPAVTSVNASYPAQYWFVTSSEYNKLLWGIAVPRITVYVQKQAQLRGESGRLGNGNIVEDDVLAARINRVSMDLALAIVAHHPAGYARHAAAHLYGMWANVFAGSAPLGIHSVAPDWPEIAKWQAVQAVLSRGWISSRTIARSLR